MKQLIAVVIVGIIMVMVLQVVIYRSIIKLENITQETITVYTTDDILYLQGTSIFSESGIYDADYNTRTIALDIFENITSSHANSALRKLEHYDEAYGEYKKY